MTNTFHNWAQTRPAVTSWLMSCHVRVTIGTLCHTLSELLGYLEAACAQHIASLLSLSSLLPLMSILSGSASHTKDDSQASQLSPGQKHSRSNALQMGPRKRPYVTMASYSLQLTDCMTEVPKTRWCTMDATLDMLFTPSVVFRLCWLMALSWWANWATEK